MRLPILVNVNLTDAAMNSSRTLMLLVSTFLLPGLSAGQEVIFQSSFDSEDGFIALPTSDDSEYEFDYDYADFDAIPEAPNSALIGGAAQRGLKLQANISEGVFSAIAIATDGLELSGQYLVQVDVWLNFNFPAGTAGTTEFGGLAVGHNATTLGFDGASFVYDTDGDSGSDYRLYKGSTFQTLETGQYKVESLNNLDEPFADGFPAIDIAVAVPDQLIVGTTNAGSGGFRWMTIEAQVDTEAVGSGVTDQRGVATFSINDAETGNKVEIGTIDNSNGDGVVNMGGDVAVIFSDIFPSVSTDQSLSFGIFDNLVVTSVETLSDPLDCSADGIVDKDDVACATVETISQTLDSLDIIAGDLDLNGQVEFADFLKLADNFGVAERGGVYANGDLDLNGVIEFSDFLTLSDNFGQTTRGASVVPEPACLRSLLLSLIAVLSGSPRKRAG